MSALDAAHFKNDDDARKLIEAIRWPQGTVCPHCGVIGKAYPTKGRAGLYRCAEAKCRKDFSVTVGTVMERSKIALHKWMMGFYLMCASKKGVSAHQLHRSLGITYEAAWFMAHRIREAMREGGLSPIGSGGAPVEADETYFGNQDEPRAPKKARSVPVTKRGKGGPSGKRAVLSLVERGGSVRSFHVPTMDKANVTKIIAENVEREAFLYTDESRLYGDADQFVAVRGTVKHSVGEYVRGDVHTNTVEGFFSIFKRGMKGVYQHCGEKHLHRYLSEFDFRYNHRTARGYSDTDRTVAAVKGIGGKRLMYRQPN